MRRSPQALKGPPLDRQRLGPHTVITGAGPGIAWTGVGAVSAHGSAIRSATRGVALTTVVAVAACLGFAFAYDVKAGLGGLIAAFLVGGVPLVAAAVLDVVLAKRAAGSDLPGPSATMPAVGVGLLLVGSLFTVIEVGVGGDKTNDVARWTSSTVGYLLLGAIAAQVLLVGLTWVLARTSSGTATS